MIILIIEEPINGLINKKQGRKHAGNGSVRSIDCLSIVYSVLGARAVAAGSLEERTQGEAKSGCLVPATPRRSEGEKEKKPDKATVESVSGERRRKSDQRALSEEICSGYRV